MLLIDHQSGLFQLVRDIDLPTFRAHVTALAKVAYLAKLPTFTTASVPEGPNGPLIPGECFSHSPQFSLRVPLRPDDSIGKLRFPPSSRGAAQLALR